MPLNKWIYLITLALDIPALGTSIFLDTRFQDRFPDYSVDLCVKGAPAASLRVDFAALKITPVVVDSCFSRGLFKMAAPIFVKFLGREQPF